MNCLQEWKPPLKPQRIGDEIMKLLFHISVLGAALLATGCRPASNATQPPPPAVTVAPVEQREIVEWGEFTGRSAAVDSVEVRPRVSGYIQEVRFQSGQLVRKGDVLFVIDPRWHQATFDQRQAEEAQAQAHLDNARREAERTSQLLANNAISVEEADARRSRQLEAKAALAAAQAALDFARLDLEYTLVRSPIAGRVSRALLTEGNYVSGIAGAATVLTTVVSVDPVYVYADIGENSLLQFNALALARKLGTDEHGRVPVAMELADETNFPHEGIIESFNNQLDPGTGTILLRATFPNADGRIVPGLFTRIRVPLSKRHVALLVAERAIGTDQAQKYVLTLTSTNTVAYHAVELGPAIEGKRVIRSGLQGNEEIVVNGLQRVRPGMPVAPQPELAAGEARRFAQR